MSFEIIAELHSQHGGDKALTREMIAQAKMNGATAAKIQLYDAQKLLGEKWRYLEFSQKDVEQIKAWCDEEEIEFLASVFDAERLRWCEQIGVRRYKIASRTVASDRALCEQILATGKPTIISLGMWTESAKPFAASAQIKYLYCKALYPAYLEDMTDFPDDFPAQEFDGYSDHTLGIAVSLLAIARGAAIIEKHMTLDKTRGQATEKAHICSMTPEELNTLARLGGALYRTRRALAAAREMKQHD